MLTVYTRKSCDFVENFNYIFLSSICLFNFEVLLVELLFAVCRTPEALHTWIQTVLDAYNFSREGTLIREARDLMNPKFIQRLEELKKVVQSNFL